jgi:hypothetical protein
MQEEQILWTFWKTGSWDKTCADRHYALRLEIPHLKKNECLPVTSSPRACAKSNTIAPNQARGRSFVLGEPNHGWPIPSAQFAEGMGIPCGNKRGLSK